MGDDPKVVDKVGLADAPASASAPKAATPPVRPSMFDHFTFGVMRLCRIDCTADEVRDGLYPRKARTPDRERVTDDGAKEALALAIRLDQGEQARRAMVQDKAKWLFTLAAGLLTLFSGMLVRRPTWFGVLGVLLVVAPLLLVTLLLLRFFGTERRSTPEIDAALTEATGKTVLLEVLESYLVSTAFNSGATDFLVDLYRASWRLAAVALCGVVALALATVLAPANNSVVEEMRGNPDLIRLLRGPEGPEGRQGPIGATGPVGPQGADGVPGACSCFSADGGSTER